MADNATVLPRPAINSRRRFHPPESRWEGRTFDHPIEAWAAGDTSQTVRDIIQAKLLGPIGSFGTGLIRKALIVRRHFGVGPMRHRSFFEILRVAALTQAGCQTAGAAPIAI